MTEDSYRLKRDQHEKYFKEKQKVGIQKDPRLLQPKPVKKHKYCTVCRSFYEDYLDHVESELHEENIFKGKNFSFLQQFIKDANVTAAENKIKEQNQKHEPDNFIGSGNDELLQISNRQEAEDSESFSFRYRQGLEVTTGPQSSDRLVQSGETATTQNRDPKVKKVQRKSKQKVESNNLELNSKNVISYEYRDTDRKAVQSVVNNQQTLSPKISSQPGFRFSEKYKELNEISTQMSRLAVASQELHPSLQNDYPENNESIINKHLNHTYLQENPSHRKGFIDNSRLSHERNNDYFGDNREHLSKYENNASFLAQRMGKKRNFTGFNNPIQSNSEFQEDEIINSLKKIKISSSYNRNNYFSDNMRISLKPIEGIKSVSENPPGLWKGILDSVGWFSSKLKDKIQNLGEYFTSKPPYKEIFEQPSKFNKGP